MNDEKYLFVSDSAQKKNIGNSARHRRTHNGKRGGVKLPSDFLTKKEREAMSGECMSYRLNEPMKWAEFKAMPEDIQRQYVQLLRERYGVSNSNLADMFETSRPAASKQFSMLGLEHSKKGAKVRDKEGWEKFLERGSAETEQNAEKDLEQQDEIKMEAVPCDSECALVPDSGELVFHGRASDALGAVNRMLGLKNVFMKISWATEPDALPEHLLD